MSGEIRTGVLATLHLKCPFCRCSMKYAASSDDYHRYECTCGAKLLVPKEEK